MSRWAGPKVGGIPLAGRSGDPLLLFFRFLGADPGRAQRIIACARRLLESGTNPNAQLWSDWGDEKWVQQTLYGAAGIANHAELTGLLHDAGATLDDGNDGQGANSRRPRQLLHK